MISPETKTALHEAIDRAQGYGACSYKAGCVVAQYLKVNLFGKYLLALEAEADFSADYGWGFGRLRTEDLDLDVLLQDLQREWDTSTRPEADARARMHAMVEAA